MTVTAGQTTTIPSFTVFASNYTGTLSITVNGTAINAVSQSATLNSNNALNIYVGGFAGQINIEAANVTAPGTYPLNTNTGTIIVGSNFYPVTAGSMVITAFSIATRRATGTFTASGGGATATGTFTDLKFR